jgi:hypothetical protein
MYTDDILQKTIFEVMIANGYPIDLENDINIFVSDFRIHLQKYVSFLIRDGAMVCKLSFVLNSKVIDFMHQRGFGIAKIDQLCEDLVRIQSKYCVVPVKSLPNIVIVDQDPQSTFQSEEILIQDYPSRFIDDVSHELKEYLITDISMRIDLIANQCDSAYQQLVLLDKFLSQQIVELRTLVKRGSSPSVTDSVSNNAYFRLIMYRCKVRNSYKITDILYATKRIENFNLICDCLTVLSGNELELFLYELGVTNLIVLDHGLLVSRFDLVKRMSLDNVKINDQGSQKQYKLEYLSEKSIQKLHWGLQLAQGKTLEEIGATTALSRERIRQILTQYFGSSYKELSCIYNDLERERYHETLNQIKLFFESNLEVSLLKLSTRLGLTEVDALGAVPKRLHRFIDRERNKEVHRSDPKLKIIEALRCAQDFEYVLTKDKYENLVRTGFVDGPGWQTVTKAFGTWNKACEAAGVTHTGRSSRVLKQYTRLDVVETYSTYMLDKTSTGSISKYEDWSVGRAVASAATIRKWYPMTADLYQACRDHIRTNRLNEYRGYIDTIFNESIGE